MQIMLFGGAFDPPHLGHQYITKNILDQNIADQVWYVPAKNHPFAKNMSPAKDRLAMLQFLVAQDSRTRIETYELDKEGVSYSYQTLKALSAKYPEHEFSWLIGSDNLAKFHLWGDGNGGDYRIMLGKYKFYVYPRKNFSFSPLYDNMFPLKNMQEIEISSTLIRNQCLNDSTIDKLVDPAVVEYIKNNQLYQKE
ncbi:MAG: nicotinate (nicotinamide) nucleotide adenylyltransferase [Candidatus Pacebacteria bacterium CG10_big_fil_rev_8_21_14_0_10_36_11]|nr:nicotinate (nicotinamide) nucleotide adenylyltransferase [Candidatus Pacearchaeota archaeon]PIR64349.1 MAG: nicotinate (nicotinamide) nucleotide adenylyltransferase [Candidatus Pacebacteria bacterium CG10_big_fil_rev_8_21_14_0_10_36_11]PJC43095.1 MAG: nicotinate (nicotinamide) nucleotide adenylyltransferase [Candidatus Pacebacteria bacterium CG_4_9_14_0_2_um_filter_36_8]